MFVCLFVSELESKLLILFISFTFKLLLKYIEFFISIIFSHSERLYWEKVNFIIICQMIGNQKTLNCVWPALRTCKLFQESEEFFSNNVNIEVNFTNHDTIKIKNGLKWIKFSGFYLGLAVQTVVQWSLNYFCTAV